MLCIVFFLQHLGAINQCTTCPSGVHATHARRSALQPRLHGGWTAVGIRRQCPGIVVRGAIVARLVVFTGQRRVVGCCATASQLPPQPPWCARRESAGGTIRKEKITRLIRACKRGYHKQTGGPSRWAAANNSFSHRSLASASAAAAAAVAVLFRRRRSVGRWSSSSRSRPRCSFLAMPRPPSRLVHYSLAHLTHSITCPPA